MLLASAYFDESTDEGSADRCYTVAGFVGNGHAALDLDMRWGELLERYDLEYFKASEIEFGFGEFVKHRDNPTKPTDPLSAKEKGLIREIKTAFIDLICDCDEMVGVGAVVILPEYERLLQDSAHAKQVLPSPYVICADFVLLEAGIMANEANAYYSSIGTMVRPIFDWHEEHMGRFQQSFTSFTRKNPISSKYLLPPQYEDEKRYRCLQAADCLAYEARRLLVRDEFEPDRPIRKAMGRLGEQIGRIYKLDYESLKAIADAQTPDLIPIKPSIDGRAKRLQRQSR